MLYFSDYKELSHHVAEVDNILCNSDNHDWLTFTVGQVATGAVHVIDKRRNISVSNSKNKSGNCLAKCREVYV